MICSFFFSAVVSCVSPKHSDLYYIGDISGGEHYLGRRTYVLSVAEWCEACHEVIDWSAANMKVNNDCNFVWLDPELRSPWLPNSLIFASAENSLSRQRSELVETSVYPTLLEYTNRGEFIRRYIGKDQIIERLSDPECS